MPIVRTNDIETYYERRGSGPPVVFVHGAVLDAAQWTPQMDALDGEYTTVAYDVRGHGRTGGSARESYSVELLAEDLRALVAALDLDRPVVCGLSMGGCIAQVYAAAHPDEVAGLVLAGTFTPELFDRREWLQRSATLRATVPFVRLLGYERVEKTMVWFHERFSKGVSGDYGRVERLRAAGPKMETAEFAKVVCAVAAFHETDVDYAAIVAPTLVLYGEREPSFVRRHAAKMGSEIARVTVREVPDAGHVSNLDDPAFFTDAVRAFLAAIDFGADGTASGDAATEDSGDAAGSE